MKFLTIILFSLLVLLIGCLAFKTSGPLGSQDFKNHKWQIVYVEDQCNPITNKYSQNIWLLDDNNIIDSLRHEYKCNLDKQSDGEREFHIYSFKDHWHNGWNLFSSKDDFSIGKLKSHLKSVTTKYFKCPNLNSTKNLIDSLSTTQTIYTVTPKDSIAEKIGEFAFVLDLGINISSKLFQNNDTLFSTWTPNAKKELMMLFPELRIEDVSSAPNTNFDAEAPGFALSDFNNDNYYFKHKQSRFILSSDKPFSLDLLRLKKTDLFIDFYVRPMYIVTTYTKK